VKRASLESAIAVGSPAVDAGGRRHGEGLVERRDAIAEDAGELRVGRRTEQRGVPPIGAEADDVGGEAGGAPRAGVGGAGGAIVDDEPRVAQQRIGVFEQQDLFGHQQTAVGAEVRGLVREQQVRVGDGRQVLRREFHHTGRRVLKAIVLPSSLIRGSGSPDRCANAGMPSSRMVVPVWRSCRKASRLPFVSPAARFVAADSKTTKRPSPLMWASKLSPSAWAPCDDTLTRVVAPVCRSCT
jgi:hypothetical protein